jgi:hypothetical protein
LRLPIRLDSFSLELFFDIEVDPLRRFRRTAGSRDARASYASDRGNAAAQLFCDGFRWEGSVHMSSRVVTTGLALVLCAIMPDDEAFHRRVRHKEIAQARLRQIEADTAAGLVVPIADIADAVRHEYAIVRTAFLGMESKLAHRLAAATTPHGRCTGRRRGASDTFGADTGCRQT